LSVRQESQKLDMEKETSELQHTNPNGDEFPEVHAVRPAHSAAQYNVLSSLQRDVDFFAMPPPAPRFPANNSAPCASTSSTATPSPGAASGMLHRNAHYCLPAEHSARVDGEPKGEAPPDVMSVQLLASLLSEMSDSPPLPSSPLPSPPRISPVAIHALPPKASPRSAVTPPGLPRRHAECAFSPCEIAPEATAGATLASPRVYAGRRVGASRREIAAADVRPRGAESGDYPLARALAELEAQERAREMAATGSRRASTRNERDEERRRVDGEATRRELRTTGSDSSSAHMVAESSAEERDGADARGGGGGIEDIMAHLPRSGSASLASDAQESSRQVSKRRGGSDGCAFPFQSERLLGRGAGAGARQRADGGAGGGSSSSSSVDGSGVHFSAFRASREDMVRALTAHLRRPAVAPGPHRSSSSSGAHSEPAHSEPARARSMAAMGGDSMIRPRTSGGERGMAGEGDMGERVTMWAEESGGAMEVRMWGSRAEHVRRRLMGDAGVQGVGPGMRDTAGGQGLAVQRGGSRGPWPDPKVRNRATVVGAARGLTAGAGVVGGGAGGAEAKGRMREGGGSSSNRAERWQAGRVGSVQQRMGPPAPRATGRWSGAAPLVPLPTALAAAADGAAAGDGAAGAGAGVGDGTWPAGAIAAALDHSGAAMQPAVLPTSASWPPPMPLLPHPPTMPLLPHSPSMPLLPHSAPMALRPHAPPRPFLHHSQPGPLVPHSPPSTAFPDSLPMPSFPHSSSAPHLPHSPPVPVAHSPTPLPAQQPAAVNQNPAAFSPLSAPISPLSNSLQGAWRVAAAGPEGIAAVGAEGMGVDEEMLWSECDAISNEVMGAHPTGAHPTGAHPTGADIMGAPALPQVLAPLPPSISRTGFDPLATFQEASEPRGLAGSPAGGRRERGGEMRAGLEAGVASGAGMEGGEGAGMGSAGRVRGGTVEAGSSGGGGKGKSVTERARRERISEELQRLRRAVRGRGDMAAMIDGAVAYVEELKAQRQQLQATLLQHQLTCTCPRCQP
ncbi:hypothetical protein CLOM_g22420, partial [Closterium sp. NIES-68]